MKVLVTGGAGFFGSHLVEELLKKGHEVVILDHWKKKKKRFIPEGVVVKKACVQEEEAYNYIQEVRPDAVIHLSAQISVPFSVREPLKDAQHNILGAINMLKASQDAGVKRFIYTSTCGVYGDTDDLPIKESTEIKPKSPYALSKKVGEEYAEYMSLTGDMSVVITRPANLYGPRQQMVGEAGVIAIFMHHALQGKELKVFGDGTATRDWLYVSDLVDAYVKLLEKPEVEGIINIGTGVEKTINDLCAALLKAHGTPLEVKYTDERPGDIYRSYLNIDRAREELGWEPNVSFEEGIRRTYEWFEEHGL